jgi:hypothetical protein
MDHVWRSDSGIEDRFDEGGRGALCADGVTLDDAADAGVWTWFGGLGCCCEEAVDDVGRGAVPADGDGVETVALELPALDDICRCAVCSERTFEWAPFPLRVLMWLPPEGRPLPALAVELVGKSVAVFGADPDA